MIELLLTLLEILAALVLGLLILAVAFFAAGCIYGILRAILKKRKEG